MRDEQTQDIAAEPGDPYGEHAGGDQAEGPDDLSGALAELAAAPRSALIARWRAVFGRPPPRRLNADLLIASLAYRLQEERLGGLPAETQRKLARIAGVEGGRGAARARPPAPGTRLVREWNGRVYVVDVVEDGVVLDGTPYGSLSAAARAITGARWNGRLFFGLTTRSKPGGGEARP